MIKKHALSFTLCAVSISVLSACTSGANSRHATSPAQELENYQWTQVNIIQSNGQSQSAFHSAQGGPVTLNFSDDQMMLAGLCNNLIAAYQVNGDRITISSPISTMKACGDAELMRYEQQVGQALPSIERWSLLKSDTTDAIPVLTLHFTDGTQWRLQGEQTLAAKYGVEPVRVFLEIEPATVDCTTSSGTMQQCLRVREIVYSEQGLQTSTGPWLDYYGQIEGYEHTPGLRQIIRLNRYPLANAPAGSAAYVDELDMVVQSEIVK